MKREKRQRERVIEKERESKLERKKGRERESE